MSRSKFSVLIKVHNDGMGEGGGHLMTSLDFFNCPCQQNAHGQLLRCRNKRTCIYILLLVWFFVRACRYSWIILSINGPGGSTCRRYAKAKLENFKPAGRGPNTMTRQRAAPAEAAKTEVEASDKKRGRGETEVTITRHDFK